MVHEKTDYTVLNLAAYYALCLFTITFVVFMSSTQSFIMTDLLGSTKKIVSGCEHKKKKKKDEKRELALLT